ncbi:MAG TPA: hypothetical protein PLH86_01240 [Saprospiraceae bacterium]|nr:hypothetical protein [Saprospiraceae bacterium]
MIFPYAFFLHLGVWLRRIPVAINPANWVFSSVMDTLNLSYEAQTIIATLVISLIAIILGNIVVKFRLIPNGQLFASIFFIIFCGLHANTLALTPSLIATLFFAIAVQQIMGIYNQKSSPLKIFNFGFFVGLASLIYLPFYIFILVGIISLIVLKGFKVRELFQILVGFFCVYFLFCTAGFAFDFLDEFYELQVKAFFSPYAFSLSFGGHGLVAMGILSLVFIAAFISLNLFQLKKTIIVQKYYDLFFWIIFVGLLSLLFLNIKEINHIHLFLVPLSILMGLMISKIKNQLLADTIHLTFIISALFLQFQNW